MGDVSDGRGPQAGWHAVYHCSAPDAELMSAAASPGRTWPSFVVERRMPVLAPALAASFFHDGGWIARVPGVDGAASSAELAHMGNQDDSRSQPGPELHVNRGLGCAVD